MKVRPIIFSGPMIRAILGGTKTQTRRIVKGEALQWLVRDKFAPGFVVANANHLCPYGQPGDRLWVRETWAQPDRRSAGFSPLVYAADYQERPSHRWRPSIHMPRWASRITLEITGVRIERLQDISEADAVAEGAPWAACGSPQEGNHKTGYAMLWESINGPGSWPENPWVWVIDFARVDRSMEAA